MSNPTKEFNANLEKTITNTHEKLPPFWKDTGNQIIIKETEKVSITESRIIQTEKNGVLRNKLLQYIYSAEEMICVSSFIIADQSIIQALTKATEKGVRVYLLTASEIHLFKDSPYESNFEQKRIKEHKQFLDNIAGKILVRTGQNLHSKFILVDPKTPNPRGLLLTANITSEALTRNLELGVTLYPNEVTDLFKQFLIGFWNESESELLEPGSITKTKQWNKKITEPETILFTASNTTTIRNEIERLLTSAQSEIILSTYGIDLNHTITQKLLQSVRTGTKVTLLVRPRPNTKNMEALIALADQGAKIIGHPWLHSKAIVVDTSVGWSGLVMTANIEQHGLDDGFETGIKLNHQDSTRLHEILVTWANNGPTKLMVNKTLGDQIGTIGTWKNQTFVDQSIKKEKTIELGELTVPSFEQILTYEPKFLPPNESNQRFHHIRYTWTNTPPKLPNGAKKLNGQENLYKHKNNLYLLAQNPTQIESELEAAKKLNAKLVVN